MAKAQASGYYSTGLSYSLVPFKDLARGIDARSAENAIADGYAEDLINVDLSSSGYVFKRAGYQGYAGYVPYRVAQVTHDGYQVNLRLTGVNLTGVASSPLIVYGKLSASQTGDFSTTAALRYYEGFSVDTRDTFSTTVTSVTKTAADTGMASQNVLVWTWLSTDSYTASNTWTVPDDYTVDSGTYSVTVDYVPTTTERVYVGIVDAGSLESLAVDYASSTVAPSGGVVTLTIDASASLSNSNVIPLLFSKSSTTYTSFLPDSVSVATTTLIATIAFSSSTSFDGHVVLIACPSDQRQQKTIAASTTDTFTVSTLDTDFPYFCLYTVSGNSKSMCLPDSVVVDATAGTMTVTVTNSGTSSAVFELCWAFATINANTIRLVDTQSATASFTTTTAQLTVWGLTHTDVDSAGGVTHIDAYKREDEARLTAGLGGVEYAARTRDEVGTTYGMPSLSMNLSSRINTSVEIAPLFQVTGSSVSRTRGIVTGDEVTSEGALVASAAYVSSGVVDYTLTMTNKVGTLSIGSQVTTQDILTITGMAHDEHNGSFTISSIPSQTSGAVTVRVANTSITNSDYDETGAMGRCNVYTDKMPIAETVASMGFVPGDEVLSSSIPDTVTIAVIATDAYSSNANGSSDYNLTVSGVTEQMSFGAGASIFGRRTSKCQPMRTGSTGSVTDFVVGDMCTVLGYDRLARVKRVTAYKDLPLAITVSGGTATATVAYLATSQAVTLASGSVVTGGSGGFTVTNTFQANAPVTLSTSGALPAGLRTDVTYYVQSGSSSSFVQISGAEGGSVINIGSGASGNITITPVHRLAPGQLVVVSRTGDTNLDGIRTVLTVPSVDSFTFATSSTTAGPTYGWMVGRCLEFDEALELYDDITTPVTVTVNDRWIPIEAPTTTDTHTAFPSVHRSYWQDTSARARSVVIGGNMYFVNYNDEVMKFDGTSVYHAGLYRWQPFGFVQVDTGTGSLTLDGLVGNVSAKADNKFTIGSGEGIQFSAGDRIVHSDGAAVYTVKSVDAVNSTNNYVYTTVAIAGAGSGTLKKVKVYSYYARLNLIDVNNNVISSASTGSKDIIVELATSGQIRFRLFCPPALGIYDVDRMEVQLYRRLDSGPYYLVRSVPVSITQLPQYNYIDIYDGTDDDTIVQRGQQDSNMVALVGAQLGNSWEQPPRAKCVTSVQNRLVLANTKDYPQLDIVFKSPSVTGTLAASDFNNYKIRLHQSYTDVANTATNLTDRITYEFVTSGAITIVPSTAYSAAGVGYSITKSSHGLSVGNWVYFFHSTASTTNSLLSAGWFQVLSVSDSSHFEVNMPNIGTTTNACDRYVTATDATNFPVWLGTDGNYNQKYGNTSGTYEGIAAFRLASAINASMIAPKTASGGPVTTFTPWLTANAGGEYQIGELVVRQPYVSAAGTMSVVLGTTSAFNVYVNGVKKSSAASVASQELLFPARVVISYENHPETFDAPNAPLGTLSDSVVDVNAADGEEILAIIPFFGASSFTASLAETVVVVFKTNSIWLLDVVTRKTQRVQSQGLGCTAPYSVAATRDGIVFANLSGIYRLNRDMSISYIGKYIERLWRDLVNRDQLSIATGHNHGIGRQYKLSVPVGSDSANSGVMVYDHTREGQDQEFGGWTRYDNHAATGWATLNTDSYFATEDGQVFKVRSVNDKTDFRDDDQAITSTVKLKAMDAGLPGVRKSLRTAVVHMRMEKSDVTGLYAYAATDNSTTFESAGLVASSLATTTVQTFRLSVPTPRFVFCQLKFVNAVKDEDMVLTGVDLYVAALSPKLVPERSSLS